MAISEQESRNLVAIKKTAVILIVLAKAGKPMKGYEIADILDMHNDTAHKHLRSLESKGYVRSLGKFEGFILTEDSFQLVYPELEKPNFPVFLPTTTALINNTKKNKTIRLKPVAEEKPKNQDFLKNKKLMEKCGIGDPMLSILSELKHVNPAFLKPLIKEWRKQNQRPGLLIHRIKSKDEVEQPKKKDYTKW